MYKIAVLYFITLTVSTSAIVVENYDAAETAPSGLNWNYIYNYKGSSAVAVGGGWILTASHVTYDLGSGSLTYGTTVYDQQEVVRHPDADLALVRYDNLPGYYPLFTGELVPSDPDPKLSVLMVGFGNTGSVFSDHWTVDSESGRGTKRWGSQTTYATGTYRSAPDGFNNVMTDSFYMKFIRGDTPNEAGAGDGDSGGGVFYNDNGTWKLAGIMIGRSQISPGSYNFTAAASMPDYANWVMATIPEPASMTLMGISTIGLFLSRAKRRRKLAGRTVFPIRHEYMCDRFNTMEEGEASWVAIESTNSLTNLKHTLQMPIFSSRIEQVHSVLKGLKKVFWNRMVLVHEYASAKVDTIKSALMNATGRGLDTILEDIAWDKMVRIFEDRRKAIQSALKRRAITNLDALLDGIFWDKMVLTYENRKKAILSKKLKARREDFRRKS